MTVGSLPLVLTVPEVAEALRIGRNAAYELVAAGGIRSLRLGRCIRVPRAEVERLLGSEGGEGVPIVGPVDDGT